MRHHAKFIVGMSAAFAGINGAWAASLTEISPLTDNTASEARAVTPDGRYVAGNSSGGTGATRGFFWSSYTGGTYRVGNTLSSHTASTGIGYRTVTGGRQIVVGGNDTSGWVSCFGIADPGANPPPNDWDWRARDANTASQGNGPRVPVANGVGGTSGVNWYFIHDRDNGGTTPVNISIAQGTGDPTGTMTGTYGLKSNPVETHIHGVSSTGRAVARRRDGSTTPAPANYRNVYYTYIGPTTPTQTFFKGLKAGTQDGEGWSISEDGTKMGGMAPVDGGRPGQWPYRYDVNTDTIVELPTYPDTGGSTLNGLVYGLSADGGFGSGLNYRGQERAVLWDMRDSNSANWRIYDLTAYFGALGQLGPFTRLGRGYSVAVDTEGGNVVVVGVGFTAAGTRGFVASIPLADFPLPDTGACCEAGFCTSRFQADCEAISGAVWVGDRLCTNAGCPAACCDPLAGTCDFLSQEVCVAGGGTYRGLNTTCETVSCVGACCNYDGSCQIESPLGCTNDSGIFHGFGSSCEGRNCTGACCKNDGTCGQLTQLACTDGGGVFNGLGTQCESVNCNGACCLGSGACAQVAYGTCSGAFAGIGVSCQAANCPCTTDTRLWADPDRDGDIDHDDFGAFQACFTGDGGGVPQICACFDRVVSVPANGINNDDFEEFKKCVTGPSVAYDMQNLPTGCAP